MPCVQAYTDISGKFDSINFNDTSFTADCMLLKGYNDLCKRVVIPGLLYIQMENFHLTGKNITSLGDFEYFYRNMLDTKRSHADSATFEVKNPSQWV